MTFESDIYIVDPDSGAVTPVTSDASVEVAPSWSHDGARIYYGVRSGAMWNIWAREAKPNVQPVLAIPNGFAAQSAPNGSLFFTRATENGLWRLAAGSTATLVTDRVPAGDWTNWSVNSRGVFLVGRSSRDIVLRHVALDVARSNSLQCLRTTRGPALLSRPTDSTSSILAGIAARATSSRQR